MSNTSRMGLIWFVTMTALVGVGRFLIPGHELSWPGTYEAFAHIWMGVLLCLIVLKHELARWAWATMIGLSVLEVVMFMNR